MPQILVVADPPQENGSTVVYRERITASDLESDHFSGQLVERVGWAVVDADRIEETSREGEIVVGPRATTAHRANRAASAPARRAGLAGRVAR